LAERRLFFCASLLYSHGPVKEQFEKGKMSATIIYGQVVQLGNKRMDKLKAYFAKDEKKKVATVC